MKNIEQALRLFCNDGLANFGYDNIIDQQEYIYATNGIILARVAKDKVSDYSFALPAQYPKCHTISFNTITDSKFRYKKDDFFKMVNIPLVEETEYYEAICDYCNETGEIKHKGESYTCPVCDGTGYIIDLKKTGNMVFNQKAVCSINDVYVSTFHLRSIVDMMTFLELDYADVYISKYKKNGDPDSVVFRFEKPIEVLLMAIKCPF